MIKLISENFSLNLDFNGGFIGTKIKANVLSYGTDKPFLNCWVQQKSQTVTAVLCKYENTFFITSSEQADIYEITEFVFAVGFDTIQADVDLLQFKEFKLLKEYCVLNRKCGETFSQNISTVVPPDRVNGTVLKAVYNILSPCENEDIDISDFTGWYADVSHRIRHNTAAVFLKETVEYSLNKCNEQNNFCAAAVISHIWGNEAVLSGIAVKDEYRSLNIGSKLLEDVISYGSGKKYKTLYTACSKNTLGFYIKNGFEKMGDIGIFTSKKK